MWISSAAVGDVASLCFHDVDPWQQPGDRVGDHPANGVDTLQQRADGIRPARWANDLFAARLVDQQG